MQNLKDKVTKFKNKWINVHLNAIDKYENFFLYVTLHNDKENLFTNIGHLGIKFENNGKWRIVDFEIERQYRGQDYGSAMFYEALSGIKILNKTTDIIIYGEISMVYMEDQKKYQDIEECKSYWKIKKFYQDLDFKFTNDIKFYKQITVDTLQDWQKIIEYVIEIKELNMENVFKDIVLESYEKEMNDIQSSMIGRYVLRKVKNN